MMSFNINNDVNKNKNKKLKMSKIKSLYLYNSHRGIYGLMKVGCIVQPWLMIIHSKNNCTYKIFYRMYIQFRYVIVYREINWYPITEISINGITYYLWLPIPTSSSSMPHFVFVTLFYFIIMYLLSIYFYIPTNK